jgi:hypothetical protein
MTENIQQMIQNTDQTERIATASEHLNNQASQFNQGSKQLKGY